MEKTDLTMLASTALASPWPAEHVMTVRVSIPPGNPGTPPHRHSGPVFGYMIEGEMTFELEGQPEYVVRAGDAFWEPGGDVIHYQAANNLMDTACTFVAVMMCVPGEPMLTFVSPEELQERAHLRVPRPGHDFDPDELGRRRQGPAGASELSMSSLHAEASPDGSRA